MTEQAQQQGLPAPPVGQGATSPDPFSEGVNRLRETAKWLITAFAGIAGVLLAGTQLSSLGSVPSAERFAVAAVSAAVALFAVGLVVWKASRVIAVDVVSLRQLIEEEQAAGQGDGTQSEDVKYVKANPRLLDDHKTIKELSDKYDAVLSERNDLIDQNRWAEARVKERRKLYLDALISQLIYAVRYDKTSRQYEEAVRSMLVWGAVAAVGIFVFAWAANPPSAEETGSATGGVDKSASAGPTSGEFTQLSNRVQDQQDDINALSDRIDALDQRTNRSTEVLESLRSEAAQIREQLEEGNTN